MLVLTRKVGEEIVIDEHVHVTVLSVRGGTVRLGIAAPSSIRVDRQEIREERERLATAPALYSSATTANL